MVLPIDIILVRHGESEGNLAHERAKNGDNSCFENENFQKKHSSLWRLTDTGVNQAIIAGDWMRKNVGHIDRFFTSEYIRAMETASHLNIKNAKWKVDFLLRERDWGQLDPLSHSERKERHKHDLDRRSRDGFYFSPPAGESIANVCIRIIKVLNDLHRSSTDKKVLIVCHGETMWAFRVLLENISQTLYRKLDKDRDTKEKIHNCQILHYTRRDPFTNKLHDKIVYRRSVCPWDVKLSTNEWIKMSENGKKKTNDELMKEVVKIPRVFSNSAPSPMPMNFSLDVFKLPSEYLTNGNGRYFLGRKFEEIEKEKIEDIRKEEKNKEVKTLKKKREEDDKENEFEPKKKKQRVTLKDDIEYFFS